MLAGDEVSDQKPDVPALEGLSKWVLMGGKEVRENNLGTLEHETILTNMPGSEC